MIILQMTLCEKCSVHELFRTIPKVGFELEGVFEHPSHVRCYTPPILELCNKKFRMESTNLGVGSFGFVRLGTVIPTGQKVAIKFEKKNVGRPSIPLEYSFYKEINKGGNRVERRTFLKTSKL